MEIGGQPVVAGAYSGSNLGSVGQVLPTVYTLASLPLASLWPIGTIAYTSDRGWWYSNGLSWLMLQGSITLAQSGIPMILPSSGTIGNNGALSAITALPFTYPSGYAFFPTNAIAAGVAAGLYFVQMSSATAGTIFNNLYSIGFPTIPTNPTPFVTTGPGAYTQNSAVQRLLMSCTVPGLLMGVNGEIQCDYVASCPNNANTKAVNTVLGGSGCQQTNMTTIIWNGALTRIRNRGAFNAQVLIPTAVGDPVQNAATALGVKSVDTSVDQIFQINGNLATASTDFIVLESFTVKLCPG